MYAVQGDVSSSRTGALRPQPITTMNAVFFKYCFDSTPNSLDDIASQIVVICGSRQRLINMLRIITLECHVNMGQIKEVA